MADFTMLYVRNLHSYSYGLNQERVVQLESPPIGLSKNKIVLVSQ